MGQDNQKNTLMDSQLGLRMTWKRIETESKKSLNEYKKNIIKTKEALKKQNVERAQQFAQTAMAKIKESENLLKITTKIKSMEKHVISSEAYRNIMIELKFVIPILNLNENMSSEQLYQNINQFDKDLDKMMVEVKLMDLMMDENQKESQTNIPLDQMIQQMINKESLISKSLQSSTMEFQEQQTQDQDEQQY